MYKPEIQLPSPSDICSLRSTASIGNYSIGRLMALVAFIEKDLQGDDYLELFQHSHAAYYLSDAINYELRSDQLEAWSKEFYNMSRYAEKQLQPKKAASYETTFSGELEVK